MKYLLTLCFILLLCTCVSAQNEDRKLSTSIFFATADHEPARVELEKLADFANTLSSYADYTLKIEAFTDEKGTESYNKALAERRATAITAALALQDVVPLTARAARVKKLGDKLGELKDLTGQQSNISRYFFSIGKLGWTNIDIFHSSAGENVELLAQVSSSTPKATVVLIPSDRRSVIAYQPDSEAEMWKRGGIPRGISYHVIAYQVMEGKMVMAHEFVEGASTVPAKLTYRPIAVNELKDKLANILGS